MNAMVHRVGSSIGYLAVPSGSSASIPATAFVLIGIGIRESQRGTIEVGP